jgi:hypothetical protein
MFLALVVEDIPQQIWLISRILTRQTGMTMARSAEKMWGVRCQRTCGARPEGLYPLLLLTLTRLSSERRVFFSPASGISLYT